MFKKLKQALSGLTPALELGAVCDGLAVAMREVADPTFAQEMLGPGVAIKPSGNLLCSPCAATVASIFPTLHAVTLQADNGAEILIHLGIDTVKRKGAGFEGLVKNGDRVAAGTPLIRFDRAGLEAAGFDMVTPVVICNGTDFEIVSTAEGKTVRVGEALMKLKKKGK